MDKFPPIVTLRLTSRCNNNCAFCFDKKGVRDMSLIELKKLFSLFSERGIKAVRLTGGEPLIREDFAEIVNELKKHNFKIFLDTNGDFFFKYADLILENVEVLGLPIDYPDKSYRNENNLKNVLETLSSLKNKEKKPLIRIGTVVTKDNISVLQDIGLLLINYPINIWKLYEFIPQNEKAMNNRKFIEVSPSEFNRATAEIKDKFGKYFKVVIGKRKDKNRAYFFVRSDGTVFMPVDDMSICKEVVIGDIFDKDIIDKWKKCVIEQNYRTNSKQTLNFDV